MKRLPLLLLLLLFASSAFAQVGPRILSTDNDTITEANHVSDFYLSISEVITNATFTFVNTNTVIRYPWRLAAIEFVSTTPNTNTLTITRQRDYETKIFVGGVVITNDFGFIETNNFFGLTNVAISTATTDVLSVSTTNAGSHIFEEETDFPKRIYMLSGDRLILNWVFAVTNDFRVSIIGLR